MNHTIETQWVGKMQFNALVSGHTVIMDTMERGGGEDTGPNPKPLILTALSGCTGMDVIAMLRKRNCEMADLKIKVTGELSKGIPMTYISAHVIYEFSGDEKFVDDAISVVNQSQETLCGVSNMLKRIMPVTWEIFYNGNRVFNNLRTAA